jgi:nucleotide-binding universal stress UspA family protein
LSVLPASILVAFDFSEPSRRALEWARALHARLHASVIVVHVDTDPGSPSALDIEWSDTHEGRERRMRSLRDDLAREVGAMFGPDEQTVRTRIVHGEVAERIEALALELGVDLIVVASSGKNAVERVLLGSTTQALVRHCPLPVMTVP